MVCAAMLPYLIRLSFDRRCFTLHQHHEGMAANKPNYDAFYDGLSPEDWQQVLALAPMQKKAKTMAHEMTSNAQPQLETSAVLDDDIKMGADVHAAKFDTAVDDSTSLVTTQDSLEDQVTTTQSEGTETNSIVLSGRASVSAMP